MQGGGGERCLTDSKNDVLNDVRGSLLHFSLPLVFEGAIKDTLGILHISINNFFPFFLPWNGIECKHLKLVVAFLAVTEKPIAIRVNISTDK